MCLKAYLPLPALPRLTGNAYPRPGPSQQGAAGQPRAPGSTCKAGLEARAGCALCLLPVSRPGRRLAAYSTRAPQEPALRAGSKKHHTPGCREPPRDPQPPCCQDHSVAPQCPAQPAFSPLPSCQQRDSTHSVHQAHPGLRRAAWTHRCQPSPGVCGQVHRSKCPPGAATVTARSRVRVSLETPQTGPSPTHPHILGKPTHPSGFPAPTTHHQPAPRRRELEGPPPHGRARHKVSASTLGTVWEAVGSPTGGSWGSRSPTARQDYPAPAV